MNRIIAIAFTLIVTSLSVLAQSPQFGCDSPGRFFGTKGFFPSNNFRECATENWVIVVETDPVTGALTKLMGTTKPTAMAMQSRDRYWETTSPQVEIVAGNPSEKCDYYREGCHGAKWWVRVDVDDTKRIIRMWGQDELGRYWVLKGSAPFPTASQPSVDSQPSVK